MQENLLKEPESNWNTPHGIDWPAAVYVFLSPIGTAIALAFYIYYNGVHWMEPVQFIVGFYLTGMGVTAGYHRYFSHKSHEAHPAVELFYLIFGATMIQRPVLDWCQVHRVHHRYADTDLDPHNINQGFYHAHMGWIYQKTSLLENYKMVPDMLANPRVMWQKKYYWWIVLVFGIGLSMGIGALYGRPFGGLLWGFCLKVVLQNHMAYSVNSIAHTWGKQTYSKRQHARDSFWLALLSNGEGYHSFHHRFPADYRNGVRWYQWDPSKWFIRGLSYVGLTRNLKKTPWLDISKARME
jgi:stearoyl-CoA desaturase (delta-9 desaturase)